MGKLQAKARRKYAFGTKFVRFVQGVLKKLFGYYIMILGSKTPNFDAIESGNKVEMLIKERIIWVKEGGMRGCRRPCWQRY